MNETESALMPGAPELLTALAGAPLLGGLLGLRNHSPWLGIAAGLGLALLVGLCRWLNVALRPGRDFSWGILLGTGLVLASGAAVYGLLPQRVDAQALADDLEAQQSMALLGAKLPALRLDASHYGVALPLAAWVHDQAERTRAVSEGFQLSNEVLGDKLSGPSLADPAKRRANLARLDALLVEGQGFAAEADRLVGDGLEAQLQPIAVPEELKAHLLDASRHNNQFSACRRWIVVQSQLLAAVREALRVADAHLLPRSEPGHLVFDGPAAMEAFRKQADSTRDLASQAEAITWQTQIHVATVQR